MKSKTQLSKTSKTTFMFFSKSKHAKAGEGASEYITDEDKNKYEKLNDIINWRRKLSNFYIKKERGKVVPLFTLDGFKWASVEHYFQASKFKGTDYFKEFTIDSGSKLSVSTGEQAKKAGRKKRLSENEIKKWNATKSEVMKKALKAKYTQNDDLKEILLLTGDAILTHRPPRSKLVVEKELMEVREQLRTKKRKRDEEMESIKKQKK